MLGTIPTFKEQVEEPVNNTVEYTLRRAHGRAH